MVRLIMDAYKKKSFFGTVKVGERGQIVIPKSVRDKYNIKPGDNLVILGQDEKEVITILKEDMIRDFALKILEDLDNSE